MNHQTDKLSASLKPLALDGKEKKHHASGEEKPKDLLSAEDHMRQKLANTKGVLRVGGLNIKNKWYVVVKVNTTEAKQAVTKIAPHKLFEKYPVLVKQVDKKSNADGASATQVTILGMKPLTFTIVSIVAIAGIATAAILIFKKK